MRTGGSATVKVAVTLAAIVSGGSTASTSATSAELIVTVHDSPGVNGAAGVSV
jgi:hypothetical protein